MLLRSAVQTGDTTGLEGEEKALALIAQNSRKPRPEPIKDQVQRALRLNQKARAGLMTPEQVEALKDGITPKMKMEPLSPTITRT